MATNPPDDPSSWGNPGNQPPPEGPPPASQQPPANWAPTPSPVQGGFSTANPGAHYPRQSQATLALILSILSFAGLCCITAPIGTVIGYLEIKAIDRGETDPANRGLAVAAVALGAVALGLLALFVVGFLFLGVLGSRAQF